MDAFWPIFGLRLRYRDVLLRPMREADLPHLAAVAMRTAALGLAFDHLGAVAAISSATLANAASLGVSRRIGYADNGISRIVDTSGEVVELQNLRLPADRWPGAKVAVEGLTPALPWFGLDG
jgi:hypothetical protein